MARLEVRKFIKKAKQRNNDMLEWKLKITNIIEKLVDYDSWNESF